MLVNFLNDRSICHIKFAQTDMYLLAEGALFWPAEKLLIFSDLHLEKGSYLAQKGHHPLPIYDTYETLLNMQQLIDIYQPETVVCLGDNLHDKDAIARMRPQDYQRLWQLCQSVNDWRWIVGNHDPINKDDALFQQFKTEHAIDINGVWLTHEIATDKTYQIVGHFHPKVGIPLGGKKIYGKCFYATDHLLMLPSFGAYTGGLDIQSSDFKKLFPSSNYYCFLLQQHKIWLIK